MKYVTIAVSRRPLAMYSYAMIVAPIFVKIAGRYNFLIADNEDLAVAVPVMRKPIYLWLRRSITYCNRPMTFWS